MSSRLDDRRLEELWTRYLAAEPITDSDREALLQSVASSSDLRALLRADDQVHQALVSLGRSADDGDLFAASVTRELAAGAGGTTVAPPVRGRRAGWAAVALLVPAAAASILWLVRPDSLDGGSAPRAAQPPRVAGAGGQRPSSGPPQATGAAAVVQATKGEVFVVGGGVRLKAAVGQALAEGQAVTTLGTASAATLHLGAAVLLEVGPNTTVGPLSALDGDGAVSVFIPVGTVQLGVLGPGPPVRLTTPDAEVGGRGAFALVIGAGRTRLDVITGSAMFRGQRDGHPQAVVAGQRAASAAEGERTETVVQTLAGVGARPRALLVVGFVPPRSPADRVVLTRIEGLGFDVVMRAAASAGLEEEARSAALIAISSTVESAALGSQFRDLPVPLVVWEPSLYEDLGMIWPRDTEVRGAVAGSDLVVSLADHPLAAGLAGRIRVASRVGNHYLSQGTPAPTALWIAAMPGDPTLATIFGYERGMPMAELPAPARRVGLFVNDLTPQNMTPAGWRLFDAAIRWAAEDGTRAPGGGSPR